MRKVLVLGGTGDIGTAIGNSLSKNDHVYRMGSKDVDLSSKESVDSFIKTYGSTFDVIVHSAGLNVPGELDNIEIEDVERSVQANLIGFLRIVKSNIPYWKSVNKGNVVVISSLYGFLSRKGRLPYAISKHGLIGAVKTLAIELGPFGILVNAVSPGYINTKMTSKNNSPEVIEKLVSGIPLKRLGTPEEIASAVEFLSSSKNTYITGQDLIIDGGFSVGGFQGT
jgi:3-oxoacyl-[acyl-carrier protein] reductase